MQLAPFLSQNIFTFELFLFKFWGWKFFFFQFSISVIKSNCILIVPNLNLIWKRCCIYPVKGIFFPWKWRKIYMVARVKIWYEWLEKDQVMNFKFFSWSIIIFHSLFYSLNIRPSKPQINLWTACYRPWSNCSKALPFMKPSYIWFMKNTIPPLNTEKYKSHIIILTHHKVKKKFPITKVTQGIHS